MIISRTPVRVSLFGGGTDYPLWFREHGGQTLGAAIDKYSYITVNRLAPVFDYAVRVSYSRMELVQHVDEIEHPAVRECMRFLGLESGVEINYVGDLPARTGLGSSSSFTVGLLQALHAFKGELVSRRQLAEEAVHVEQELIRERVGVQDQYTCAHGGLLHLGFDRSGAIRVNPVPLSAARRTELQSSLMLFYTGVRRHAHEVLSEQLARTASGAATVDLAQLSSYVDQALEALNGTAPMAILGELLHDAWTVKKRLSTKISNDVIDGQYAAARAAGAVGGKLLGAGGGGFLLLICPPERQPDVVHALQPLARIPIQFDFTGASVLFYQPE